VRWLRRRAEAQSKIETEGNEGEADGEDRDTTASSSPLSASPGRQRVPCSSSGSTPGTQFRLSDQERFNLRSVLISVEQPYPRLRRPIPLPIAVQTAHYLWEGGSPRAGEDTVMSRVSDAVRGIPTEMVERTLTLGSNIRKWGEGMLASASQMACAASPTSPWSRHSHNGNLSNSNSSCGGGNSRKNAANGMQVATFYTNTSDNAASGEIAAPIGSSGGGGLLDSIRGRGGLRTPSLTKSATATATGSMKASTSSVGAIQAL